MKILISCISLSLLTHVAFSSEILSEFGSSTFTIDSAFTTSPFIQNSNSITITGTDDPASVVYGSFTTPFTILDIPNSLLCLNFAISGSNPDSAFHIDLYNADASAWYTFTGTIEGVTSVASDVALVYYDLSGDPFNEVFTALIGFDGSGSDDINMTLNNISVVPEPATYFLITIAGLFFIFNLCHRRTRNSITGRGIVSHAPCFSHRAALGVMGTGRRDSEAVQSWVKPEVDPPRGCAKRRL